MDFDDPPPSFLFCLMCGLIAARICVNSVHSAHFHCSLVPFSSCSLHHETVAGDSPCNHLFRCDKIPLPLHHARYFFIKPDYPILLQILDYRNILPYNDDWGLWERASSWHCLIVSLSIWDVGKHFVQMFVYQISLQAQNATKWLLSKIISENALEFSDSCTCSDQNLNERKV